MRSVISVISSFASAKASAKIEEISEPSLILGLRRSLFVAVSALV